MQQRAHRLEEPKRGIDRVVFRSLAGVRKTIWEHASINMTREFCQDTFRNLGSTGYERQSRQRDHRVAAPIAEPVIAGNYRLPIGARSDELVRRGGQRLYDFIRVRR